MSNLIIVESPTKAKTITKFLPSSYEVVSSYGHIRDLPKSKLGVNTETLEPEYVIPTKARKNLNSLKKKAGEVNNVILATDEDREGEAIAYHLQEAMDLGKDKAERIVFHEITEQAIKEALENPRDIEMNLVNAQQARRLLDRLVGYQLSPFLWKKIMRGLSAGRVQSVAVRLIVEREREIQQFTAQEYWSVQAKLKKESEKDEAFTAMLYAKDGKALDKFALKSQEEAEAIIKEVENESWKVNSVETKESKRNPLPPFTTSTLQQAAWQHFGFPAKRTMTLAQNLYERGFITYHRTDSLNLAKSAVSNARAYIKNEFGEKYLPEAPRAYKTKSKGAQEAHEAIRPVSVKQAPENVKLDAPQKKLYTLIWQRFIASQMTPAVFYVTAADIKAGNYTFRANGQRTAFPGFTKVYPVKIKEHILPKLEEGDKLSPEDIIPEQHFTKPPPRYTEASLVKALEKYDIGRPSTYASIISTIQTRNYIARNQEKRLEPNEIGFIVTDMLTEHFPRIVDIKFTADMEEKLDEIAEGKENWKEVLREFYEPFSKNLEEKYEEVEKKNIVYDTDKICPECNKNLVKRMGKFGWFYACSGFPACKYTEPLEENNKKLGINCPKCKEGELRERQTKKGKTFYGCDKYPDCDFATWDKPHTEEKEGENGKSVKECPKCGEALVEKENKSGTKIQCSNKECKYEEQEGA